MQHPPAHHEVEGLGRKRQRENVGLGDRDVRPVAELSVHRLNSTAGQVDGDYVRAQLRERVRPAAGAAADVRATAAAEELRGQIDVGEELVDELRSEGRVLRLVEASVFVVECLLNLRRPAANVCHEARDAADDGITPAAPCTDELVAGDQLAAARRTPEHLDEPLVDGLRSSGDAVVKRRHRARLACAPGRLPGMTGTTTRS